MKTTQSIEGHKKLEFKTSSEASKAFQKVKRLIKKTEDAGGILVLRGCIMIIPSGVDFNPANAIELT